MNRACTNRDRLLRIARRVAQSIVVVLAVVGGLAVLGITLAFGDCAGWKGTGTCPRDPWWDWEVFGMGAAAAGVPYAVIRTTLAPRRARRHVTTGAAVAAGAGVLVLLVTGS